MAKKNRPQGDSGSSDSPAANESMEKFLEGVDLTGYDVGQRLTLNIWEPQVGEIRAFVFEGQEERESTKGQFAGSKFDVHYGKDLKTGEDFSFIGGGLFSFTIRDRKIEKGTPLIARYMGLIQIDEGARQAKQWEIRTLAKK